MTRKLAHWRVKFEHPGMGADACRECQFWTGPNVAGDSCRIVAAPVRAGDWCNRFRRKR